MKILIDKEIPFVTGIFEPYAEVEYLKGEEFSKDIVKDADALVIKGHTRCDENLLEGSNVKMIATTLVGVDHIDMAYCNRKGIFVQTAKGTTAVAVSNYVFSAIYGCAARRSINLSGLTMGIVGYGSVGTRIEAVARTLGFKVLIEDPPRAGKESPSQFCSLDELLAQSDIVTLHVPLNERTKGLCNMDFFDKMKFGAFFINTSPGDLVCESDLIKAIPKLGPVIIDCWNNEPDINTVLLEKVDIGTPHIASFTYQSKLAATRLTVRGVARYFGIGELFAFNPTPDIESMDSIFVDVIGKTQGQITSIFQYNYPIFTDDFMLRVAPWAFNDLRVRYKYRREFHII